jgi:CheY-like chemotaxis protein
MFLRILRADKHLWRLPVVVVTARQMNAAERRELERKVVGFIEKGDSLENQLQEVLQYVQ